MNLVIKHMYKSLFQSVLQSVKSNVCYSKAYSFLLGKSKLLRFLYWKERKVVPTVEFDKQNRPNVDK